MPPPIQLIASICTSPEKSEKLKTHTRNRKKRGKCKDIDCGQKEDKIDHGARDLSISASQNSQGVILFSFCFYFFLMRKLYPSYN